MNTPDPDELHKELESGPLQRPGFTSRLQRDIEQAIDRKDHTKSRVRPLLCFVGIGAIVAAVWIFPWHTIHTKSDAVSAAETSMAMAAEPTVSSPIPINTALLIGLRTEHEDSESIKLSSVPLSYNTYRTMLIAPVRGKLQKTSEGSGILMPYKQNFWKIDSLVYQTKRTSSVIYLRI
ncbi:hypothetical protein [Paenibacillus sp. N3.4]|uniref:hypothetical protein n=1 Tax=Paenibacillus sp. N3.4 TaxID=2603222 RepID=UPI0011C9EED3|nr:hypothetical protein [Paenibacillus sp. N3.4]TXK74814.1 hypothetical protein FU659_28370 [Paenibacillus sp. N3.4]